MTSRTLTISSEIEIMVQEMRAFYGDDASKVAAKNIALRGRTEGWRKLWLAVWKALQT